MAANETAIKGFTVRTKLRYHSLPTIAVLLVALPANDAAAQEYATGPLLTPAEAMAQLSCDEAREAEAYTLGVQTVLWAMQWVKAGAALRNRTLYYYWKSPPSAKCKSTLCCKR